MTGFRFLGRRRFGRLALCLVVGLLVLGAIGMGVYVLSARSSDETPAPPTSGDAAETLVTDLLFELDLTWSPPEALPDSDRRTISDALRYYSVQALFPSPAPDIVAGPLSAGLWVTRTVPTNLVSVSVFVRTADGQPFLSVTSADSTWAESAGWLEVQVRGASGRFHDNSVGVRFLTWEQGGRTYNVDFGNSLSLEQATAWLASWYTLP
jgi:hypothetical protein